MIKSKKDYREYEKRDMAFYRNKSGKERFICWLTSDPIYDINRYIHYLRKEEFFYNTSKSKWNTIKYLLYFRKKNVLGNRLGFKIPKNCFGPGLTIYHHGEIIVNEAARIGSDCVLHGGNCIGNNGKDDTPPCIGDELDLGIGAKIIGSVQLGNNVVGGANAVVTKSYIEDDIILIGIPASKKS